MSEDKVELTRVGSLCNPDPHIQLLDAWRSRDLGTFCDLLKKPGVSADHWYGEPHLATCLYLTCKEEDGAQYASALLKAGADPKNVNPVHKEAPIHVAAKSARVEVLEVLLSDQRTDVNILDDFGNTPLHLIAKQKLKGASEDIINKYKYCIRLLMKQNGINLNIINRKGYTAVHFGAENDAKEIVKTILENAGDHLDVDSVKSARDTLLQKYPEFAHSLLKHRRDGDTEQNINILFQYLINGEFDTFIAAIESLPKQQLEEHNGSHTLLQYCAENGLENPAIALLHKGVDPNATCQAEPRPPALLACYGGHPDILKLFVNNGPEFGKLKDATKEKGTAFHAVVDSTWAGTSTVHTDYKACLDLLLEHLPNLNIDINAVDLEGNTALHYAAKNKNEYAVLSLLKHGAYIGIRNVSGEPPLANIPPKMLETFLNDCLDTNGESPSKYTYEVTFSYKFLVPPSAECCMQEQQSSHTVLEIPLHSSQSSSDPPVHQKMSKETTNTETEPLLYISQSRDLRYLLTHPIFTSFLDLKWHHISIFFYINLIFYILFVTFLTAYILCGCVNSHISHSDNTTVITEESGGETLAIVSCNMSGFWRVLSIIFWVLLISREVFQLLILPAMYLHSPENYLELLLLMTSASILFYEWDHPNVMAHLSSIAILCSWAELVLLIGRHPRFSTYIEMFKTVAWNFLKFLAWYAILIVGFALSFYTLFRDCGSATECGEGGNSDENFFLHPGMSVFKTVIMLTGEFDAASIPFGSFPGTSHIIFVLFIFLISIVLFNLLTGLAVSDTQAIRNDAEIMCYIARVKLVIHIETLFQSSSLPIFGTLKRICHCWPAGINCLTSIKNRVYLFPDKVPDNKIRVLPNQRSRIIFTSRQEGCRFCTLDSKILERALEIINNRDKISEMEEVKTLLTLCQKILLECKTFGQKKLNECETP